MFPRTSATCLVVCRLDIPEIETVAKNRKLLYVGLCIKYWRKCIGFVYVYDFGLFNGAGVYNITSYPRVATTVSNRKLLPRARRKKRQHSTVMWRSCFSVLNGWVTGITDLHVPQPEIHVDATQHAVLNTEPVFIGHMSGKTVSGFEATV